MNAAPKAESLDFANAVLSKAALHFCAFRAILTWNQYDKCSTLLRTHSISSEIYTSSLNHKHYQEVAILTLKAVNLLKIKRIYKSK